MIMARTSGEEYRFYQQKIDESLSSEKADAEDFVVREEPSGYTELYFQGSKVTERAAKDLSKIIGVPRKLMVEVSRPTMTALFRERFKWVGVEGLQVTSFDGKVISFLPRESAYRSPLRVVPEGRDFFAWWDMEGSDAVRFWFPNEEFAIGESKYRAGARFLVCTTTKRIIAAEPRVEKVVCENGLMKLVSARMAADIPASSAAEVIAAFFVSQTEEAADYAAKVAVALREAEQTPVSDMEEAVASMAALGGLTPRATRKVFSKAIEFSNPETDRTDTGVDGPMHTAADYVQLATLVAKTYSDNSRESLERMVSGFLVDEFAGTSNENRHEPWKVVA